MATQWLRDYEEDNPASLKELINLVLKSSGCDFQVSEDDINDPDNVPTRLNDLQEEYKGVSRSVTFWISIRSYFAGKCHRLSVDLESKKHTRVSSFSHQFLSIID